MHRARPPARAPRPPAPRIASGGVPGPPAPDAAEATSNAAVGAVAKRLAAGLLATAEPDLLGLGGCVLHGREAGSLVRAVAERLRLAATAGAPPVFPARLDGNAIGRLLRWNRLRHIPFSLMIDRNTASAPLPLPAESRRTLCDGLSPHKGGGRQPRNDDAKEPEVAVY